MAQSWHDVETSRLVKIPGLSNSLRADYGAPIGMDAAVVEIGVDVRFTPNTSFGLTYTGQFSDAARDHGFNARLSVSF